MGIEARFIDMHPNSAALYARASKSLPSGVTHDARFQRPFPIYVDRAHAARKRDIDGHELVDYVMGHGSLLLGHAHPVVTEAAAAQVAKGSHYGAGHELEVRWAEEIIRAVPSAEVVRFTSSGTEATLMALRLARSISGRATILKFDRHFHGWHDYVIASSHYGAPAPAGVPETTLESVVVVAPEMHVVRETVASRPDIGAVIVEASGASMGAIPLPDRFLRELGDFCREREIVFVMDEVVTGFRWSVGGVQQREGVTPDLTALAKILAGGFPGGAVAGRRDIMERLNFPEPGKKSTKVGHPGTFNANPVSAAAGVACLSYIAGGEHQARAEETAHQLQAAMNGAFCELQVPGYAYGAASIIKFVVGGEVLPEGRAYHPLDVPADVLHAGSNPEAQRLLNLAMANHGVHVFGNGMIVSAVHTAEDVDRTVEAWRASLRELREDGLV